MATKAKAPAGSAIGIAPEAFRVVKQTPRVFQVGELAEHPQNPRDHDIGSIGDSISRNGFYGGPVVWQRREALLGVDPPEGKQWILAGAGRVKTAVAAGAVELPGWEIDVDAATAARILLADNKTSDRAGYRDDQLLDVLQTFINLHEIGEGADADSILRGTGWDSDDVDELLRGGETTNNARTLNPDERLGVYQQTNMRQIMLLMDVAQYENALARLSRIREHAPLLETNVDIFFHLLDTWDDANVTKRSSKK